MTKLHFTSSEKIDLHPEPVEVNVESYGDEAIISIRRRDNKYNLVLRLREDGVIQPFRMIEKYGNKAPAFLPVDDDGRLFVAISTGGPSYSLGKLIEHYEDTQLVDPLPEVFYTQEEVDELTASARAQGHTEMQRAAVGTLRDAAAEIPIRPGHVFDSGVFLDAAKRVKAIRIGIARMPEDDESTTCVPNSKILYMRGLDDGRAGMQRETVEMIKNVQKVYPDGHDRGMLNKAVECIESMWSRPEDKS